MSLVCLSSSPLSTTLHSSFQFGLFAHSVLNSLQLSCFSLPRSNQYSELHGNLFSNFADCYTFDSLQGFKVNSPFYWVCRAGICCQHLFANIMHAMTSIYKLHVDIKNTDTLQRLTFAHSVFSNLPCFSYYTHTYKDLPKNATSFCVVCVTGITTVAQKSIISIFIHYNQVFKLSLGGISEVPVTNLFLDACRGENWQRMWETVLVPLTEPGRLTLHWLLQCVF